MELATTVGLVVLTIVVVIGAIGYVIDRGAGRLER